VKLANLVVHQRKKHWPCVGVGIAFLFQHDKNDVRFLRPVRDGDEVTSLERFVVVLIVDPDAQDITVIGNIRCRCGWRPGRMATCAFSLARIARARKHKQTCRPTPRDKNHNGKREGEKK